MGVVLVLIALVAAAEPISQLNPSNYVNDFAGVLNATTQSRLNDLCHQVEEKAKAQIAVVTVKSTDGEDVFNYAVNLYQKWGIGKKGSDRGVLILLAVNDRKYWTAVGYGLEPILPDGKVGGFGREAVPYLQRGDYSGAVTVITSRVADVIARDAGVTLEGYQLPEGRQPANPPEGFGLGAVIVIIIFVLIVLAISRAGRGGGGGFWSGLILGTLLNSRRGGSGGWGGGGWGGGGFGGGGGGFGGFGGGSTGGGGAGGSW